VATTAPRPSPGALGPRARHRPDLDRKLVSAAGEGDQSARAALVDLYQPLIARMARRYRSSGNVDRADLMQEGAVGLFRALERYDPSVGASFWAYASWWVRQAMQQLVAELARPMVLSDRALRQLARVKAARREYLQANAREPSTFELAAASGLSREQVQTLLSVERSPRSLDDPLGSEEGEATSLGERVADPRAEDDYDRVTRRLEVERLAGLPSELSERERVVLRARYGLDRPEQTLREIAGRLELSAERVRQIEDGALEKLRTALNAVAA
jgi:RNA polymerase primary sigma factor